MRVVVLPTAADASEPRVVSRSNLLGLDAVRGWAAVGVVTLHACAPYADRPMPGLSWSVAEPSSRGVSWLMWSIEVVIMPIFLAMAGFLAAKSVSQRGGWATFTSRLDRLGKPLLVAMIVLLPIDFYVWLLGWLADGLIEPKKLRTLKFDGVIDQNLWGLAHLWFLQYLITYIAALAFAWKWLRNDRWQAPVLVACGVTATIVLTRHPEVVWGFQHSFWPVPSKWLYSVTFFFAGAIVWQVDPELRWLARVSPKLLGVGAMTLAAAVAIGLWRFDQAATDHSGAMAGALSTVVVMGLAALTVIAASGFTAGIVGLASRSVTRLDRVTATLAGGSFFVYLVHHPLVGLTHVTLKHTAEFLPVPIKLLVVVTIGVGWPLLLRAWWLGKFRPSLQHRESILSLPRQQPSMISEQRRAG